MKPISIALLLISILLLSTAMSIVHQSEKPGYVIIKFTKPKEKNLEKFKEYARQAGLAGREFGGKPLAGGQLPDIMEGKNKGFQFVLLEFPSKVHAKNWYYSDQYAQAKKLREGIVDFEVIVLEGS